MNKLSAGSGYDYLTRSVCCDDATGRKGMGLASYYTEKGDVPGRWLGAGVAGIDGIDEGGVVTAEHMKALFGVGMHPLAIERNREFDARPLGQGPTPKERAAATRLGIPFKVYSSEPSAFTVEIARRQHAPNKARGERRDAAIPDRVRAQIRSDVARDFFVREYGREPDGPRELAAMVAKNSRPAQIAVAGYDITFTPVKSVSTLWALADPELSARIELAHRAAISDALQWAEKRALFTREGTNGVRQVNTRGMVAAAFVHRDSRAGDPNLHTHVTVANKVQTLSNKWLAIDGKVLLKAKVSISETYNTALEKHLTETLGVRFAERPDTDRRKRPIREIVGVDPGLNHRFSKRRASIKQRTDQLTIAFQHDHGRPPTPFEAIELAQQATLETRQAKHEPRTLEEQRAAWRIEAIEVLGSERAITEMVHSAIAPAPQPPTVVDSVWLEATAKSISETMASKRAVWQFWHVYAEAQRRIREVELPSSQVEATAEKLTELVFAKHAVRLAHPTDPVREPETLRRRDGISVYTSVGSTDFTTAATLAAERRLVEAAGRTDGRAISEEAVGVALLECAANGISLNPGQATLVREMATSGARLQLAIAPAGSGKTTAMRALATAWTADGGMVLGLAPSAVAAAELGSQIDNGGAKSTDTLAKLVHAITTGVLPQWATSIGPKTLLVIDEAGMADTLSLDLAVNFAIERGASVRLIGDDQQLAAIGAGGVLRDIRATHGALQLSELMRFHNPAEGAASLALRDGRPEALGFYLDNQRIHIGDQATMAEAVFEAWRADLEAGRESLMLAPTRDLVGQLNLRARAHRLCTSAEPQPAAVVRLADGNEASVGDVIITRTNDRSLRISSTDWVKNGDRWQILGIVEGGIRVQHRANRRTVFLPTAYIAASTDLGYACTVHTAQGVTADTTHGLLTGDESRQQLYTLATRGREANHLYLTVASDGDPHNLIHPDVINPKTATEILETILGRDGSSKSATTLQRDAFAPAQRLGEAVARYTDSLYFACEDALGDSRVSAIENAVELLLPGIGQAPAWPALRAHLVLIAAHGDDPVEAAKIAVDQATLASAHDPAAVLDWRLDRTGRRSSQSGPLPWLPAVPQALASNELWGPYLHSRGDLVNQLAAQVREEASSLTVTPAWVTTGVHLPDEVIADVEVWRAANLVSADDLRPTGPSVLQHAAARWQRALTKRVTGPNSPAIKEWGQTLADLNPALAGDAFAPVLAERLAAMSRAGVSPRPLLETAADIGHLPDDHAAAALWWRISGRIAPAVAARMDQHDHVTTSAWLHDLAELLGQTDTARLRESSWWPALLAVVDHGLQRGWVLPDLLALETTEDLDEHVDLCQALVWRASIALADLPDSLTTEHDPDAPPEDLYDNWTPPPTWQLRTTHAVDPQPVGAIKSAAPTRLQTAPEDVDRRLLVAAMSRELRVIGEQQLSTDVDLRRAYLRANEWDHCPLTRERMVEINTLTQQYYVSAFGSSWAQTYLQERFGFDLGAHELFHPGHAPSGWTHLVEQLRRHGVSDDEMVLVGVAGRTRDGRLIDKFRDRVTFPIANEGGEILGFVGRRAPHLSDGAPHAGPKYLNTPDTPLFHKGAQLFGVFPSLIHAGAIPVVVEGPMDAIAVTLASAGSHLGVAPLGTALTEDQAIQLTRLFQHTGRDPIVATDADAAGRAAAERDFWILASVGLEPGCAPIPPGTDPASVLTDDGAAALAGILRSQVPLADELITDRLAGSIDPLAHRDLIRILAASGPDCWDRNLPRIAQELQVNPDAVGAELVEKVRVWDANPRRAADAAIRDITAATHAERLPDRDRYWLDRATTLDPRLAIDPASPLLARLLVDVERAGHDAFVVLSQVVSETRSTTHPARGLIDGITAEMTHRTLGQREAVRATATSKARPSTSDAAPAVGTASKPSTPPR